MLRGLPSFDDPNLLVGPEHFSDAGVYRLADGLAVVQSVDFFPPLVDDPFIFGQIAAANSMSDVYAMGGRPTTALNIVGFPDDKLPMQTLQEILRGGAERVAAAGAVIVGGHSVRDVEIKYGLAVTGVVDPNKMLTNRRAQPGDALVLTKALGTGFITTANRAGKCPDGVLQSAIESMIALNSKASEAAVDCGAHAMTDITGFGLAGHAHEMAEASNVTIHLRLNDLPLLPGARELAKRGFFTRANAATRVYLEDAIEYGHEGATAREQSDSAALIEFLFDPQTSGGLLVSLAADRADAFVQQLHESGVAAATIVGEVRERAAVSLVIE